MTQTWHHGIVKEFCLYSSSIHSIVHVFVPQIVPAVCKPGPGPFAARRDVWPVQGRQPYILPLIFQRLVHTIANQAQWQALGIEH